MEDYAKGMTMTRAQPADAVAKFHLIVSSDAPHRSTVDGEYDRIAFPQWHDRGACLHARALLGDHELTAVEVDAGLRQQDRDLQWKTCSP